LKSCCAHGTWGQRAPFGIVEPEGKARQQDQTTRFQRGGCLQLLLPVESSLPAVFVDPINPTHIGDKSLAKHVTGRPVE
jgi:hypothetical protein